MTEIGATIERITHTLDADGPMSTRAVLGLLDREGVAADVASTALAAGVQQGAFTLGADLKVTTTALGEQS